MDKFVIDSTERIEQSIAALQTYREQLPSMFMQQFPGPCVMFDTFLFAIGPSYPLFMNLAFVFACAMIIKSIVYEKEKRLKETMRTMGLGNGVHWTAWFFDSLSMLLFACVLLPIIIYVRILFCSILPY